MTFNFPLMDNNITREDLDEVIDFLKGMPRLTQSCQVQAFEKEWSDWLGVKHSVFVNSGSSANLITLAALKHLYGNGEIIVPPLTWVSDIAAVIQNGFDPVFVDIDRRNLCMDADQVIACLSPRTMAVFLTHVQGFNGLKEKLLAALDERGIPLIEDVCESHGATFRGRKLGAWGWASNFSFYFAHHMSTVEGGMVSTSDDTFYETLRMLRSHGLVREALDSRFKDTFIQENPELSPDFIFAYPAYNVRNTEIGAVLGRNQLKRLDENNERRRRNFDIFLSHIDSRKYRTDFDTRGSCNYAFNLILREPDPALRDQLESVMRQAKIEFRRGSSGGGNQLRQPYLKGILPDKAYTRFPQVEHIHFYGYYIGNLPAYEERDIVTLCNILNNLE